MKNNSDPLRPKIALVVGSGGWKCLGTLELFHFLKEVGVEIDLLVGCSGGAMAVTCMGMNIPLPELKAKIARTFPTDFSELIELKKISQFIGRKTEIDKTLGLINSDLFLSYCNRFFEGKTFEELSMPCIIQTTDLDTGKEVILEKGDVASAVVASSLLYPFVSPIFYQNRWLIDGGYSNSLPIDRILDKKIDIVIIVNSKDMTNEINNVLDFWLNFFKLTEENWIQKIRSNFTKYASIKTIYLEYQLTKVINFWDFKSIDYAYSVYAEQTKNFQDIILDLNKFCA